MNAYELSVAVRKKHRETKNRPLMRDEAVDEDGYKHQCAADGEHWPCLVIRALNECEKGDQR